MEKGKKGGVKISTTGSNEIIYPENKQVYSRAELSQDKKCYGIDLGTTTTLMCVIDSSNVNLNESIHIPVQFIKVEQKSPFEFNPTIEDEKVASMIGIYNGKPYVGNNLYHLKGHPEFEYKKNLFYHWKTEMGIDHEPMYPNAVSEKLNMPYKIAGGILNYIRRSRFNDSPLSNTIITVPASFQANQRKDVLRAAEMAKINISENMLIDEPNAAFLGYFNRLSDEEKNNWAKSVRNKNVLVIDFGGGTLDLSILNVDFRRDKGISISNQAISRYNDLGGQDIDWYIAEELLIPKLKKVFANFDETNLIDIKEVILPQLALIGENLKIGICNKISLSATNQKISDVDLTDVQYSYKEGKVKFKNTEFVLDEIVITAKEFEDLFSKTFNGKNLKFKYIDKTISTISTSINDILSKAELPMDEIHFVLFVGGSSFNPFLHSMSINKLTKAKPLTSHEPDKLVAEGAAVYSYFLNVHNISLISPITSETIGIIVNGNRFYTILEKGVSLPQRVDIPDFKLQTNLNSEVIVPVCINGVDFQIGEIRAKLQSFYSIDAVVKINAEVTSDKIFKIEVSIDGESVANAEFENPYGMGKQSKEEMEINSMKKQLYDAKRTQNYKQEKSILLSMVFKQNEIENHKGCAEICEDYISRFDDQNEDIWNFLYISNRRLGRTEAAKKAINKAMELSPDNSVLNFNYSIFLEETEGIKSSLDYLIGLNNENRNDNSIRLRIINLKNRLGQDIENEALEVAKEFKGNPLRFSDFEKKNLLPAIFRIINEPYAFVDPKNSNNHIDSSKLLDTNNLPF
jgi:molecular chaperone DnaK (HSP70)